MSISKYIRIGLRADKSLADLPNKPIALSNVLDDLIPNQSFIPGDLTVINGLGTTDVWAQDLKELTTLTETYSPLTLSSSGDISIGAPIDVQPRSRVIDIIRNDEIVLGTPPVGQGGSGPIAKVFPAVALTSNNATLAVPTPQTADNVFDSSNVNVVTTNDYWIDGRFGFGSSFYPGFPNQFGGISWEGWMENSSQRDVDLLVNGFIIVEKYNEDADQWTTVKASYNESHTAEVLVDNSGDTTRINVTEEYIKFIWVGMVVNGTHEVSGWNEVDGVMSLTALSGQADIAVSAGDTITITREVGEFINTRFVPTDPMIPNATQKIRITTWYPQPDDFSPPKTTQLYKPFGLYWDMDIQIRGGDESINSSEATPYSVFYPEKRGGPDFVPKQYSYEHFERNVISTRNRHSPDYLQNDAPLYIRYAPKQEVAQVSRFTQSTYQAGWIELAWTGGSTFKTNDTLILRNLNIGDYLLFNRAGGADGTTENYFLQIYDKVGDYVQVEAFKGYDMNQIMTFYGFSPYDSVQFFAFNPTGVVGIYTQRTADDVGQGNSTRTYELHPMLNSDDQNNSNTDFRMSDPIVGDLIVNLNWTGNTQQATQPEVFDRITSMTKFSDRIEVNAQPAFTSGANPASLRGRKQNTPIIVYSHRGLIDASTSAQCSGVYGREVAAHASFNTSGQTGLALTTVEGISQGDYVQFLGAVSGTPDENGNSTGSVTTVNSIDTGAKTIQLTQNLLADIPAARTVVFSQNNPGAANKELCVMPLNTAPPFEGTDLGLETTSNFPSLNVNGEFSISGIKFESAASAEITNNNQANSGLLIKTPSGEKYWALMDS